MLVHLPNYQIDTPFILVSLDIPDSQIPKIEVKKLTAGWDSFSSLEVSRLTATKKFADERCLAILVPSVVMNLDFNLVINPLHNDFSKVKIVDKLTYKLEMRFNK